MCASYAEVCKKETGARAAERLSGVGSASRRRAPLPLPRRTHARADDDATGAGRVGTRNNPACDCVSLFLIQGPRGAPPPLPAGRLCSCTSSSDEAHAECPPCKPVLPGRAIGWVDRPLHPTLSRAYKWMDGASGYRIATTNQPSVTGPV